MLADRNDWTNRLEQAIQQATGARGDLDGFVRANLAAIGQTLAGKGPEDLDRRGATGAHVVVNISSAVVKPFCEDQSDRPYKNYYDLIESRTAQVGETAPSRSRRETIDTCLPLDGHYYKHVYFGAVDVNGSGIRFYGDMCFVLKDELVTPETIVLDRNSYDLERAPFKEEIARSAKPEETRRKLAERLSGSWERDLISIVCMKLLDGFATRERRLTTGEISQGVLVDEDYVEVLWVRSDNLSWSGTRMSFAADDLLEVRISAADVALEERIAARERFGPVPTHEELQWRAHRRDAEAALRKAGVAVRVVTTAGRVRS